MENVCDPASAGVAIAISAIDVPSQVASQIPDQAASRCIGVSLDVATTLASQVQPNVRCLTQAAAFVVMPVTERLTTLA